METANGVEVKDGSPKKPVRGSLGSALESRINALGSGESREFLWGCELTKDKKAATWLYGAVEEDEEDTDFLVHTLYLRHAVLGAGAAKEERNVVQVETKNFLGEEVKMPIGVLCLNRTDMCTFDLNFGHDVPVTFRLVEGNGPVHIIAQHAVEWPQDAEEEFMTEETATTETEEELPVKKGKRKASASPKKGKAKRGKLDTVEEVTEEDETEETEEDMEEDEEEDLEEEESEEEESEEEEEESEEEEAPKKKGKGKPKGKPAPAKGKRGKSPKGAKAKAGKGKKK